MRTRSVCALVCLTICAGMGPDCRALTSRDQAKANLAHLSLSELGNVKVTTTTKEPEEVWQTPAAIYVITQDDIRRSGATTIPELLRMVPGMDVARIDSDHWAIGVRGFNGEFSKALLVMIDGRSVYSPLFAGVYWQVQDTLLADVERIEVIRGPGGTIWGANAVQGVINIITKNAKDTHGTYFAAYGGNVDQGRIALRYGAEHNGNLDYRTYGKGSIYGPEFHPDGQNFDEWKMGQLGFRTDWRPTRRDSLNVQGDLYKGRDGERVAISFYSPPSVAVIQDPAHQTSGGNVVARWRHVMSAASDFELRGYFDRTLRFSPQLDEIRNTVDLDFLFHFAPGNRQDVLLGVGARWSPDHIRQKFATLDFEPHDETDSIYSWFAQDQVAIVPNTLSLIFGSKFEHNNRSGFEVQPNVRLLWKPTQHQTFWAAVTRAVRTPSRLDQDLQLTDYLTTTPATGPIFLRVLGSKNFKSEVLWGTELGYRTLITHNIYVDTAIFRNEYNDLYGYSPAIAFAEPDRAPAHTIFEWHLANALKGDTSGGEIAPDWKPSRWFELKGWYAYLHLFVHDKPGFTDDLNTASDNGSSPHHQVRAQALFNFPKGFAFNTTYRYVSSLPAQTVNAYSTADARVAWHPTPHWALSVTGQNLLQPHHAEFGSDVDTIVGIKRAVYAKLTWSH